MAAFSQFKMPRYSAFVAVDDGPGRYQELEELIEAPDPRGAAQRAIELAAIHPDEEFPIVLVVEESQVATFSRDDSGLAVTPDEDFPRQLPKGPATIFVRVPGDDLDAES
jgi:hypothetical protein